MTGVVKTSNYARSVRVAATVVERSGRSLVQIPAPVTGVVTEVYAVERDLISPQQPLFEIQLTHEDVVTAQTDFLEHLHHKAARLAELKRLRKIGSEIIAGKRIIEQQYKYDEAVEKVEGLRQGLLLHGLSKTQIATIESSRELLRKVTVVAPPFADLTNSDQRFYHLQKLEVRRGAIVEAGSPLAVLADHSLLFVEGQAFEGDAQWLFRSVAEGAKVEVVPTSTSAVSNDPLRLEIQSVADRFDPMSRALKFYLLLPNEKLTRSESGQSGEKGFGGDFIGWKYRPGQPMEALLRTEDTYENHFVLPADAVVIDGPNAFVFEQNGDNFDRVDVRVLYRDKDTVVVKRNSRLIGSVIAMTAAFDMHLALKNAAGGPIDPHAGHTH